MKKKILALLVTVVALVALTGCPHHDPRPHHPHPHPPSATPPDAE